MPEIEAFEVAPRTERLIWRSLGVKSVRQIAEETGLKPEEILRVKKTLLEEIDALTIQETRAKLLSQLQEIANEAMDRAARSGDDNYAGGLTAAVGAINAVLRTLEKVERQNSGEVEALNAKRVEELFRMIQKTVDRGVQEISVSHNLDEDDLFDVFNKHLVEVASEMDVS